MDYFMGDAVYKHEEPGFDRNQWIRNMQNLAEEHVPKWWAAVKDKYGHEAKYCVVGTFTSWEPESMVSSLALIHLPCTSHQGIASVLHIH